MSSKTKIVVLRMKELIYTAAFIGLGVLLILLLIYMFSEKKKNPDDTSPASYIPGIYVSAMVLNGETVEVAVTVDKDHINTIEFRQLDDSVSVMYPLMQPALEKLQEQIIDNQSLENLNFAPAMKYTQNALLQAIQSALDLAAD